MSVRVVYKDFGLKKVIGAYAKMRALSVRVGVVGAKAAEPTADGRLTNAENAMIQQYGLAGPPGAEPRDFLDQPFKSARAVVESALRRATGRMIRLEETPEQAMDWVGGELEKVVRDAIYKKISPHNAPATVANKGFDHPLIDTLGLYDAVSHRVVRENGDVLEAGSADGDYESFEIGGSLGGE